MKPITSTHRRGPRWPAYQSAYATSTSSRSTSFRKEKEVAG